MARPVLQIDHVLTDRGSRYAVTGGPVSGKADIAAFLAELRAARRYAKATHHSWAVLLPDDGPLKNDDGEAGAGAVILRMLERARETDPAIMGQIVVVTRWYGGVNLGGDRFAHIVTAVRAWLDARAKGG